MFMEKMLRRIRFAGLQELGPMALLNLLRGEKILPRFNVHLSGVRVMMAPHRQKGDVNGPRPHQLAPQFCKRCTAGDFLCGWLSPPNWIAANTYG